MGFINSIHPRAADEDFLKHAVIITGEIRDAVASGDRTGKAHGSHHRFGAGVAERRAFHVG